MKLSRLQKYILFSIYGTKGQSKRNRFSSFYDKEKKPPKKADQQGIITRSLERLIEKGLLIGYGRRTPEKWFINEVKMTAKGKMEIKRLFGKQQAFPFKFKKIKK